MAVLMNQAAIFDICLPPVSMRYWKMVVFRILGVDRLGANGTLATSLLKNDLLLVVGERALGIQVDCPRDDVLPKPVVVVLER